MITKHIVQKIILLSICFFSANTVLLAEQATLTDDLTRLHVPVIKYKDKHLWVDFSYQENSSDPIIFTVKDFAFLADNEVPPSLNNLSIVTDGEPPLIVNIKDTEATLTFVSTIPLACSVIYGKTPAFGAVSTDANMNGGAIIDHNPILSGLEADTLYYYRVQGTDAQGKLYWQATNTFNTEAATAAPSRKNLLSLKNGATVSAVSSNFAGARYNETWGAESAIDGDSRSEWSSNGNGNDAFIVIKLAQSSHINSVEVWSRSMSDGTAKITSFTLTTDKGTIFGPFDLKDTQKAHEFILGVSTSFIRLDVVSSTGGNTGLVEFSAFQ